MIEQVYYSLQNKKTKKLIKVYSTPFNNDDYGITCYVLSTIGDSVWLTSKENVERALKTPNYNSESDADYDNPYNWLDLDEWKAVKITLNIEK